jgi:hypothetical protein
VTLVQITVGNYFAVLALLQSMAPNDPPNPAGGGGHNGSSYIDFVDIDGPQGHLVKQLLSGYPYSVY